MSRELRGACLLILDADGVLRRLPDGDRPEGVREFESVLLMPECLDVLVVAAGEWKRYLSLGDIRQIFSPAIGARIVDVTPEIEGSDLFRSHVEIYAFLDAHPEIADYVVVESGCFGGARPYLESACFVHPIFSEADVPRLAERLAGMTRMPSMRNS